MCTYNKDKDMNKITFPIRKLVQNKYRKVRIMPWTMAKHSNGRHDFFKPPPPRLPQKTVSTKNKNKNFLLVQHYRPFHS